GVAYRTALKARAAFAKRQKHEARTPGPAPAEADDDLTWREVRQALHAELHRTSECYRAPLVLCYLEGKTQDEAARLLGVSAAALAFVALPLAGGVAVRIHAASARVADVPAESDQAPVAADQGRVPPKAADAKDGQNRLSGVWAKIETKQSGQSRLNFDVTP